MVSSGSPRETYGWWQAFCGTATAADRRNQRRMAIACSIWCAAFLGSLVVLERYGENSLVIAGTATVVAAVAWIPTVRAYLRFLRETDELTRLIQMQAMAIGFASGLLASLLDRFLVRVASFLPERLVGPVEFMDFFNPAMVMCVAFVASSLVLHRWYSR